MDYPVRLNFLHCGGNGASICQIDAVAHDPVRSCAAAYSVDLDTGFGTLKRNVPTQEAAHPGNEHAATGERTGAFG